MRQVSGQLEGKLDSKTAKAGDEVVLKTSQKFKTAEGVVIPKGSRLVGHVTEVQAHSKQQAESHMGLEFDRVELRGGQSMAIHSMIESISPSAERCFGRIDGGRGSARNSDGRWSCCSWCCRRRASRRRPCRRSNGWCGDGNQPRWIGPGLDCRFSHTCNEQRGRRSCRNSGRGVSGTANGAGFVGAHATGIQGVMLNGDAAKCSIGYAIRRPTAIFIWIRERRWCWGLQQRDSVDCFGSLRSMAGVD